MLAVLESCAVSSLGLLPLKEAPQWGYSDEDCKGKTFKTLFSAARFDELLALYDSLFPDPSLDTNFNHTHFTCYAHTQQWQKALDWLERILPQNKDDEDFTLFYYNTISEIKLIQHHDCS